MPVARKTRQPRRTKTDQLLATQNQILDYLRQDVEEWRKTGERYDHQQHATLQALAAISKSLASTNKSLAATKASQARQIEMVRDIHAITTRVLEQSNHVMLQLGASGATH
jgi:alkylhydroperoxidase family enzyme